MPAESRAFSRACPATHDQDRLNGGMSVYELRARPNELTTRRSVLIVVANVKERITSTARQYNAFLSSVIGYRLDRRQHRHREAIPEDCKPRGICIHVPNFADMA